MSVARSIDDIATRVEALRQKHADRDERFAQVRAVRHGDFDKVAPDLFSDEWPRPIVANRIDVMAKHASAALSPLPIISCQSITSTSDRAREFADKRSKIANHYVKRSRLQAQMQTGADQFYTYGLLVTSVEPDAKGKFPHIYVENAIGFYPVWDRLGRTVEMARVFTRRLVELIAEYPDQAERLHALTRKGAAFGLQDAIEVTKHVDADRIVMYLSKHANHVLVDMPNPLGRCTYVATQKPNLDDEIRGTFDDLIWVQLALHAMQTFNLSAAAQAVEAPLAVPNDVVDVPTGPGAVIRTNSPEKVRRVNLDVPSSAFTASSVLSSELEYGAITPEALGGSIDASVVTGKGVQQLMAGYSQQIAMCQQSLVGHFEQVIELCLEMDERFWPEVKKSISGLAESTPYSLDYRAGRDIDGDYSVTVQYGGIAGLDPNRGLVFLLQGLGADLISKDYVRRHLPSDINAKDEENKIAIEKMRASLMEGLAGYAQSIPALAAQGQDPSPIISGMVKALGLVQKGKTIEEALSAVFPEPEPEPQPDPAMGGDPAAAAAGPEGFGPSGLPDGLTPGVASRGQGARPDLAMMFAGTNGNGSPNLQAGVSRYLPAGGGA